MQRPSFDLSDTFQRDTRGGLTTIVGFAAPVLAVVVCGAVELAEVARTKAQLQTIVDSAAIAGARQLTVDRSLASSERTRTSADAQAATTSPQWTIATDVQSDPTSVTMTVTQKAVRPSFFGSLLPPGGFHLNVTATASSTSKMPLCVLASTAKTGNGITMDKTAIVTAANCLVQSNSSVQVKDSAYLTAGATRAVGAASGAISPGPLTDSSSIPDPFASLPISLPPGCKGEKLELSSGTVLLNPGVHCDKLLLSGTARVVLNAGDHYFTGGGFDVQDDAEIVGDDVVMIFKGQYMMGFKDRASLAIEGRRSGTYAGFALITDRSFTGTFAISSDRARRLLGTLYLPSATFKVSGTNSKVADQSPWTIVVANKVDVSESANLVINSNYGISAVPVPTGVGGTVRLSN